MEPPVFAPLYSNPGIQNHMSAVCAYAKVSKPNPLRRSNGEGPPSGRRIDQIRNPGFISQLGGAERLDTVDQENKAL